MEVLDSIYNQFFFTANSLGHQLTTSQFFQPLIPQALAHVATAIHCALCKYACGKEVTVMFSQDENQGIFCHSAVIDCISAEAIALIKFKLHMVGLLHTTPPMVLVLYNRRSLIPDGALQSMLAHQNPISHLQSGLVLRYFIQRYILPFLSMLLLEDGRSSIPSSTLTRSASISFQRLYLPCCSALIGMKGLLHCITSAKCKSVRKPHANLPDTPADLTGARM